MLPFLVLMRRIVARRGEAAEALMVLGCCGHGSSALPFNCTDETWFLALFLKLLRPVAHFLESRAFWTTFKWRHLDP